MPLLVCHHNHVLPLVVSEDVGGVAREGIAHVVHCEERFRMTSLQMVVYFHMYLNAEEHLNVESQQLNRVCLKAFNIQLQPKQIYSEK